MKLRCLWDNVLVLVDRIMKEKLSKGGIIMPETRKGGFRIQGEIIATGPGAPYFHDGKWLTKPMSVKAGDRITFEISSGTVYPQDDGSEYILLVERQITGIFPTVEEERAAQAAKDAMWAASKAAAEVYSMPVALREKKPGETEAEHVARIKGAGWWLCDFCRDWSTPTMTHICTATKAAVG